MRIVESWTATVDIADRTRRAIIATRGSLSAGRKSKEDFLRQLRGGKSERLFSKSNPPQLEKKIDE